MKLLYAANVFGDEQMLSILKEYASEIKPDTTVIAGNIVREALPEERFKTFANKAQFEQYKGVMLKLIGQHPAVQNAAVECVQITSALQTQNPKAPQRVQFDPDKHLKPLTRRIIDDLGFEQNIRELAKLVAEGFEHNLDTVELDDLVKEADANLRQQYEKFAAELAQFPQPAYSLPGNLDGKCFGDHLKEKNLHLHTATHKEIIFAGYGSSLMRAQIIPDPLQHPCVEQKLESGLTVSEAVAFYLRTEPDIIVSYTPPIPKGIAGVPEQLCSEALDDYIQKLRPAAVLTGVVHNVVGADLQTPDTVAIYPGTLGEAFDMLGGEFAVLDFDSQKTEFQRVTFYRITDKAKGRASIKPTQGYELVDGVLSPKMYAQGPLDAIEKRKRMQELQRKLQSIQNNPQ